MHRINGSAELSLTGIALVISRSENRAFSLFKVVSICNRLIIQAICYEYILKLLANQTCCVCFYQTVEIKYIVVETQFVILRKYLYFCTPFER